MPPPSLPLDTIARQQAAIAAGDTTAAALVDEACARAEAPEGEGGLVFLHRYGEAARQQAQHADTMRAAGVDLGPLAGMPVSIKDLFDVAGETTRAGSIIRRDAEPAAADAAIVRRLKGAGAILVGRTNMTEFAYSGIGINPHYGTPANPWDRENRRIPGGSSSGAAVSVADGMAIAGIGTDTGGSVRIPAALNGLTGFKPTARRVPQDGCFPALLLPRQHRPAGRLGRLLRPDRRRDGRRGPGAVTRHSGKGPAPRHRAVPGPGRPGGAGHHGLRGCADPPLGGRRPADRPALRDSGRHPATQHRRRARGGGGAGPAPPGSGNPPAGFRPPGGGAHPERRKDKRRGLCRPAAGESPLLPGGRCTDRPVRRRSHTDKFARRAADRRPGKRRCGLRRGQPRHAAQHGGVQLPRPLRHDPAHPSPGRGARSA